MSCFVFSSLPMWKLYIKNLPEIYLESKNLEKNKITAITIKK